MCPIKFKDIRSGFQNIILLIFGFLILLLIITVIELMVRIFFPSIIPQYTERSIIKVNAYHDSNGLQPGARGRSNGAWVVVDKYGFRSSQKAIAPGKKCWLYLGDSATMGIGIDQDSIFSSRVAAGTQDYNILNAALIGYSTDDYVNVFNHFIDDRTKELPVSRVTIFYCLNDVYTSYTIRRHPNQRIADHLRSVLDQLNRNSRAYLLIKHLTMDRARSYFQFDEQFYQPAGPELHEAIADLKGISEKCKVQDIQFDVVILPYEYQLRNYADTLLHRPQILLKSFLSAQNIKVHDCLEYLVKHSRKSQHLYLPGDGIHFSNLGHRLMANFIIDSLSTR